MSRVVKSRVLMSWIQRTSCQTMLNTTQSRLPTAVTARVPKATIWTRQSWAKAWVFPSLAKLRKVAYVKSSGSPTAFTMARIPQYLIVSGATFIHFSPVFSSVPETSAYATTVMNCDNILRRTAPFAHFKARDASSIS